MTTTDWNAPLYEGQHTFVWQYGQELLNWLLPEAGEHILDLGCGTGQLTAQLAQSGAEVQGMDAAPSMIEAARRNFPQLRFDVADARSFTVLEPVDAVFSNAALHWIPEADAVIGCVERALKPGGRFVAEFGGKGNVQAIVKAVIAALQALDRGDLARRQPWFFPSLGEYAARLEAHGLAVTQAVLFDRPTPLVDGEAGLGNWLQMFAAGWLADLNPEEYRQLLTDVQTRLFPLLHGPDGWMADYRRLRIRAVKPAELSPC